MARTEKRVSRQGNEQIDVRVFEEISIRFPGDVYILANWIAMSDAAKRTPTSQPHTTLHGLARLFAIMHGTDYSNPLKSDDVMAVFREHGISGNPTLQLAATPEIGTVLPTEV